MKQLLVKTNPIDFLKCQFRDNVFIRADTLVRVFCVKEYLKKNKIPYLYVKDCSKRFNHIHKKDLTKIEKERTISYFIKTIEGFKEKKEYDKKWPIETWADGTIKDGTHRLSCAIAMEFDAWVLIRFDQPSSKGIAGFDYYKNNFNEIDIEIIKSLYKEYIGGELK